MASRSNIYIDQGADFRITLELFDGDDDELVVGDGGYSFYSSMRKFYTETNAASFTIEVANNDVTLVMSANTSGDLKPGKYEYDVLMKKPTGEISKVVEGLAIVVPTISEAS
jgi:hypothetical protein